ncbi:MAG: hypothetical protein VB144_08785 [Clostridia bacterium]|nr:hypothetical protein [Clostridia bacterium]
MHHVELDVFPESRPHSRSSKHLLGAGIEYLVQGAAHQDVDERRWVTGTLLYNPRRSPLGRYVVVPFDMMAEAILKDFTEVHSRFAAYVKKDDIIAIMAPAPAQE